MKASSVFCFVIGLLLVLTALPACKAKTCDGMSGVADENRSRKKTKNMGLFSKKEMRRKKW